MSISLVDSRTILGDTFSTQPSHVAGDTFIAFGYRDANATVPTKPSGWVNLYSVSVSTGSLIVAYKYAQSNADTFGTWVGANHLSGTVWRGSANTIIFPSDRIIGSTTNTSMSWGGQTTGTFAQDAEDVALFAYGINRNTTNNLGQTLGALTNLFADSNGSTFQTCGKFQTGRLTAWASTAITLGLSSLWRTVMLILIEQTKYGASGTPAAQDPLINPMFR